MSALIGVPLGYVMWFCYQIVRNYGLALLIFTILTRLVLLPFTLKQQKSMAKTTMLQPQIAELQNKYKNNKQKLNEEMMKLYQQEGYNPMSGCLPLLIQFPILFGLIDVIYKPLKHILHLPADVIKLGEEIYAAHADVAANGGRSMQLEIVNAVRSGTVDFSAMGAEAIEKIQNLNLNFLGMDLTMRPAFDQLSISNFNPVVLIPFLAGISQLFMSMISMRTSANNGQAAGSMKGMMYTMPLLSVWIGFTVPAGVGLYWFYSSLIGIVQQLVMNKFYNPREMAEKARLEMEERKEKERQERIEAKKVAKESGGQAEEKALSAKEINRRKLAEARKRDAEKYGEEYVEATYDDLN